MSDEYQTIRVAVLGSTINSIVYNGSAVRHVLYLKDKVYIVSGTGKIDDPYILGLDTRTS